MLSATVALYSRQTITPKSMVAIFASLKSSAVGVLYSLQLSKGDIFTQKLHAYA